MDPLRTLNSSGWVEVDHGAIYGEPVSRIRAQGKMVGRDIQISGFTIDADAGKNLRFRQIRHGIAGLSAHGAERLGLELARIQKLKQSGVAPSGALEFSLSGSGSMDCPQLRAQGRRVKLLSIAGEPFGDLQIAAHTADRALVYDLSTHFQSASLVAHGQTTLDKRLHDAGAPQLLGVQHRGSAQVGADAWTFSGQSATGRHSDRSTARWRTLKNCTATRTCRASR